MEMIVEISGVSERQIRRILKLYDETGSLFVEAAKKSGRRCHLTSAEVGVRTNSSSNCSATDFAKPQYILGCIDKNCDTYLDELCDGLKDVHGVRCSPASVWRCLTKNGYTMKKVSIITMIHPYVL
jgi:transposase